MSLRLRYAQQQHEIEKVKTTADAYKGPTKDVMMQLPPKQQEIIMASPLVVTGTTVRDPGQIQMVGK